MKIRLDNDEVFELTQIQQKVIQNDIPSEIFVDDVKRRLKHEMENKYQQCYRRLKEEWEPKLAERGVEMIPTNQDAFAQLVFTQPDYKDRSKRNKEEKEKSNNGNNPQG